MAHIGLLCPPSTGHLNAMTTLGHALQQRGHRVTFVGVLDAEAKVRAAGLDFCAVGLADYPLGKIPKSLQELGQLEGSAAVRYTFQLIGEGIRMQLRDIPAAVRQAGIDLLLIDQVSPAGGTIADYLNIPFISVCNALPFNREPTIPPPFTSWLYQPAWWAKVRNSLGYRALDRLARSNQAIIQEQRQQWKLPPHRHPDDLYSQLAQVSQQPMEFDFPRQSLPRCFHYTGPYHSPVVRESTPFPFEQLTGQPLIYASLGTIQNRLLSVFQTIAEACQELDAQLVISLGGGCDPTALPPLPGSPLVMPYVPQLELLSRTTLTITHAGLNTTLESLAQGIPMVAIPITNDQPGVAARIAWSGSGQFIRLSELKTANLKQAIQQVLTDAKYKQNALKLQQAIQKSGGANQVADIVEQVLATGKPVYSTF